MPTFDSGRPGPQRQGLRQNPSAKMVDLERALAAVSPKVRFAALEAHEALKERGVPHMLVGGLAVGAHGYPYATQDVDFVVGDEAFEFSGRGHVSFARGIPIQIDGVQVDYLSPDKVAHLDRLVESTRGTEDLCVVPIEQLMYMKLLAGRQKDQAAIVGLFQTGTDTEAIRTFIAEVAPALLPRLDRLIEQARREEG
ncbi:MAG TPA: hypothetical protein PLA94_27460 [Myxococcota bacterium]|nr:hypothetical protein [Myxococcota bacterium]